MSRKQDGAGARVGFWMFSDDEVFDEEMERIFKRCWLFVAHESEIPEPGDYVTRRLGRDPVIVVRDRDGQPQVFLNSCPHRGNQLCTADIGSASKFQCSYHGWTFSTSGDLLGVPELKTMFPPDFDKADHPLHAAPHVDVFCGLIFATWDADAPSLLDYLEGFGWYLEPMLAKTAGGMEVVGPPTRLRIAANWKLAAENFSGDGYHLNTTHSTAISLGLLGDNVTKMETAGYNVDCHGHTIRIQKLPLDPDQPMFLGYPPEMWPEFLDTWDGEQARMMSGLLVAHGVVFPNLGILDAVLFPAGDDVQPIAFATMRQFVPVAPGLMEQWAWLLQPKDAPEDWKAMSQEMYSRTLGVAGLFDVDDTNNFQAITNAMGGETSSLTSQLAAGTQLSPEDDLDWPGRIYMADHTETNQLAFYRRWAEEMNTDLVKTVT